VKAGLLQVADKGPGQGGENRAELAARKKYVERPGRRKKKKKREEIKKKRSLRPRQEGEGELGTVYNRNEQGSCSPFSKRGTAYPIPEG